MQDIYEEHCSDNPHNSRRAVREAVTAAKAALKLCAGPKQIRIRYLKELGWKSVGTGGFATVLAHPDNDLCVLRVATMKVRSLPCGKYSDGFNNYAQAIMRDWVRSKLAPIVYALVHDWEVSIAVVERCSKNGDREYAKSMVDTVTVVKEGYRLKKFRGLNPKAVPFLENVQQYGELDIHSKNIMRGRDGRPVIVDPLICPA